MTYYIRLYVGARRLVFHPSPRDSQVIIVSGCLILTAVNLIVLIRMAYVTKRLVKLCKILCDIWHRLTWNVCTRADKGWAVKQVRPSKKVWCSGLGLCLEISLVFDFGQGLRSGLYIRHCRCHWIMAAWFVFLHFFLVLLCWYAVSERQMLLFFAGGLVGVDKHLFQRL